MIYLHFPHSMMICLRFFLPSIGASSRAFTFRLVACKQVWKIMRVAFKVPHRAFGCIFRVRSAAIRKGLSQMVFFLLLPGFIHLWVCCQKRKKNHKHTAAKWEQVARNPLESSTHIRMEISIFALESGIEWSWRFEVEFKSKRNCCVVQMCKCAYVCLW